MLDQERQDERIVAMTLCSMLGILGFILRKLFEGERLRWRQRKRAVFVTFGSLGCGSIGDGGCHI